MATHALTPAAQAYSRGVLYEWLTTTDHKKIGMMYVINSFIFFVIAGVLALVVRTELAQPGLQFLTDEHVYNEMFTMHATIMIFLFVIPMLAGLGNYIVPLQIGAPDMAFPRLSLIDLLQRRVFQPLRMSTVFDTDLAPLGPDEPQRYMRYGLGP
ncbi:MAG: cbb3-type cytochrome c oxidase subunit I, partial [Candidatus Limnocylindrales bacterium]